MSGSLKKIYKEIISNCNLHDNIPEFLGVAAEKYSVYAAVRLALNYYTFYEIYWDDKDSWSSQVHDYVKILNSIISDAPLQLGSGVKLETYIKQIDDIRRSIIIGMEKLTLFVDLFEIYEYVLNRVEYRFKEMGPIEEDEELSREVLRYIFEAEDNVVINDRIREIIGQLPIRITKKKYFDYLSDGLRELVGAQEDILETHLYMIRGCAMLDMSQDMKEAYPDLWLKKEKLEEINFKDISKEEYDAAVRLVQEATDFLEVEARAYYGLIEVVNELYTLLICTPYTDSESLKDNKQISASLNIIEGINSTFFMTIEEEAPSEMLSSLEIIEGIQEDMEYDIISLEDILYHIDKHHGSLVDSLGRKKQLESLLISKDIYSGSIFMDLNETVSDKIVDPERLNNVINKLIKELEDRFKGSDRMIIRAIMAYTMDKVPIFFNTHTEVMDYVLYSLNKCTDLAEKYASIEIIESLME
jgi:hypothetical protein